MKSSDHQIVLIGLVVLFFSLSSCSPKQSVEPLPASSPSASISTLAPITPLGNQVTQKASETPEIAHELINPTPPASEQNYPLLPNLQVTPTFLPASGPALAFLKAGDIWLLDGPGSEPYPLTIAGDIKGFTWTPDGERIIAYNGKNLCFYHRDGSVRTSCLELGLTEEQAAVERRLVVSPDQRWVVLWNPESEQTPGMIGWMILALDTSNTMYRIEDPVDWGASFSEGIIPGGFTGQPVFLRDGRLIGTLSHPTLCKELDCSFQLFEFDLLAKEFIQLGQDFGRAQSFGAGLTLVGDGFTLSNVFPSVQDCKQYSSMVYLIRFTTDAIQDFQMSQVNLKEIDLASDLGWGIFSHVSPCPSEDPDAWQAACGLDAEFDVLPMQSWESGTSNREDLYPGLSPKLSPDGKWLAFTSCLTQDSTGAWTTADLKQPEIFLYNLEDEDLREVMEGKYFEWRP